MRTTNIALGPSASISGLQVPFPIMVAAFCLLWSSAFSVAKLAIIDCPPLLALTARFLLAGMFVFGAASLFGAELSLGRRDLLIFAVLGIANQAVYLGLSYLGIRTISSGLAALVISANPVLTAVMAALFLGERMTWRKGAGLLLGIGGVTFIVQSRLSGGADHAVGIVLAVAALVSLAVGTIVFKRFMPAGGLWIGTGVQNVAAGLTLLPIAFASESIGDIVPSWRLFGALIYLALLVSVFAYLLWFHLLAVSEATEASSYHFMMPPLGMLFGWLLLGEHVALTDLVGIVPVALGIYLVTRSIVPQHDRRASAIGT